MRKLMLAVLAVGALTAPATAVPTVRIRVMTDAGGPLDGCTLVAVTNDSLLGVDDWTGVLVLAGQAGWCEVRVNGIPVSFRVNSLTPVVGVGVGAGQVSFEASNADTVTVCRATSCEGTDVNQVPREDVYSLVNPLLLGVDAALCPVLGTLAPGVDPLRIDSDGDVYVFGGRIWDCPPYGD